MVPKNIYKNRSNPLKRTDWALLPIRYEQTKTRQYENTHSAYTVMRSTEKTLQIKDTRGLEPDGTDGCPATHTPAHPHAHHTHVHIAANKKVLLLLVNVTVNSSVKAVMPARVRTHTHPFEHEPREVRSTRMKTTQHSKAKWLGVRCLQIRLWDYSSW